MLCRIPATALPCLLALVTAGGCIVAPAESPDGLAERYAREETRLIDEAAFEQARERSRLRSRSEPYEAIETAAPLDIDPAVTDRWQFGTLRHPLHGEPVCAAVSGVGQPSPEPGADAPRLVVLGDGAFVTSTTPFVPERTESAVRIDGGLPIPLELSPDAHVARLALEPDALFARLRSGAVATLDVALAPFGESPSVVAPAASGEPTERFVELDALDPMLDELERCGGAAPLERTAGSARR